VCPPRRFAVSAEKYYSRSNFIETQSGNKISRDTVLCGSQNIVLQGKTIVESKCIIRGDLANVRVGRLSLVFSTRAWG